MTAPAVMRPGGSGISRSTDSAVTDLPEPLSPTTATVSPGIDGVADPVNRANDSRTGAKFRVQVLDFQKWRQFPSPTQPL